jgi:probable poly-beta-1,6-N-acetyl-D-glucosamine export protein
MNTVCHKSLSKRDESFDFFRGITIIAVVAIHVNSVFSSYNSNVLLLYRQSLNFAVPVFLFISGYFLSNKKIDSFEEYKRFLTHRLSRVLIPYLFWSILILSSGIIISHDFNIKRIVFKLLTGGALVPYYFIILIVQFYLLTPMFHHINKISHGFILIIAINILSLLFSYITRLYYGSVFSSLVVYAMPFYMWIVFYEFGVLYRNFDRYRISNRKATLIVLLIAFSLVLSLFEAKYIILKYDNLGVALSAVKFSSFLYSGCFIAGFLYIRQKVNKWPNIMVSLGNYSFGIYLIHMLVIYAIIRFLKDITGGIISQIMIVFVTLIICCFVIYISKKVLPCSMYGTLLGF